MIRYDPEAERITTSYSESPARGSRVLNDGNASYEDFLEILVKLGTKALPGVVITEESPDEATKTPVVAVGVIHETPLPNEIKPRPRSTVQDIVCNNQDLSLECRKEICTNYPYWRETCGQRLYPHDASQFRPKGQAVVIWGQRFRNTVQFDCWGETSTEADRLARRFKKFMFTYTGVFRQLGVGDIIYLERLRDARVTKWREDIYARSLRYTIIFEDLFIQEYEVIQRIAVELSADMRQLYEKNVAYFSCRGTIL